MSEDNPFAEFQMGDAPADPPAADKPKRARKKKASVLRAVTDADIKQAAEKKARKPRGRPPVQAAKAGIATLITALVGLKEDDAKLLTQIVQVLQASNKKSRGRIVAALGKIFA